MPWMMCENVYQSVRCCEFSELWTTPCQSFTYPHLHRGTRPIASSIAAARHTRPIAAAAYVHPGRRRGSATSDNWIEPIIAVEFERCEAAHVRPAPRDGHGHRRRRRGAGPPRRTVRDAAATAGESVLRRRLPVLPHHVSQFGLWRRKRLVRRL